VVLIASRERPVASTASVPRGSGRLNLAGINDTGQHLDQDVARGVELDLARAAERRQPPERVRQRRAQATSVGSFWRVFLPHQAGPAQ
jgi:hypothetical protein